MANVDLVRLELTMCYHMNVNITHTTNLHYLQLNSFPDNQGFRSWMRLPVYFRRELGSKQLKLKTHDLRSLLPRHKG